MKQRQWWTNLELSICLWAKTFEIRKKSAKLAHKRQCFLGILLGFENRWQHMQVLGTVLFTKIWGRNVQWDQVGIGPGTSCWGRQCHLLVIPCNIFLCTSAFLLSVLKHRRKVPILSTLSFSSLDTWSPYIIMLGGNNMRDRVERWVDSQHNINFNFAIPH